VLRVDIDGGAFGDRQRRAASLIWSSSSSTTSLH
jgi:hypothetical protein